MFLFRDGWALVINRLNFSFSKNCLFSRIRILKSSENAEWLENSEWSPKELFLVLTFHWRIQSNFRTGMPVWAPEFWAQKFKLQHNF